MTQNMNTPDRLLRFTAAALLGIFIITGQLAGVLAVTAAVGALVLLGTSAVGTCPFYRYFSRPPRRTKQTRA